MVLKTVFKIGGIKSIFVLSFIIFFFYPERNLYAQTHLVNNLKNGKSQNVVVYGTSLSSGKNGHSWMREVSNYFNNKYDGKLTYSLSGKSGMWSTWGVQNLQDSVLSKQTEMVIIEFGINDAFKKYKTSPRVARLNLEYMIERILLQNPSCEIVLQVMNMPIRKSADFRPNLNAYYAMYRTVAKKRKLTLVDHYPNWQKILDQGEDVFLEYVPDGIHPSEKSGREIIAPFIIDQFEGKHNK